MENSINSIDDPIVKEIDVFLDKSFGTTLFVAQHSNICQYQTISSDQIRQCRIKKKYKKIEIEYELDTTNENYNRPMGEQIGKFLNDKSNHNLCENGSLETHIVQSSCASTNVTKKRITVGFFQQPNRLILHPISALVQFRPIPKHLDTSDFLSRYQQFLNKNTISKTDDQFNNVSSTKSSEVTAKIQKKKLVDKLQERDENELLSKTSNLAQVKLERQQRQKFEKFSLLSNHLLTMNVAREPWVILRYCEKNDKEHRQLMEKCLGRSHNWNDSISVPMITKRNYLKLLFKDICGKRKTRKKYVKKNWNGNVKKKFIVLNNKRLNF
ncbi:hypothetical protein SNEBB_004471 [Seison nebaliae]|nr:hypothetical protein SNEBB_004471 [Seison nebaliae]